MKRILVTGANGFIGQSALPILAAQHDFEIHAVTSRSPVCPREICCWHITDLLNAGQVHELFHAVRPTHLLHLAWYTAHGDYWNSPQNSRWVQASQELLRQFHLHGSQRAVVAGTCAEYDWRTGFLSETTTPLCPRSTYGACKKELFCWLDEFSRHTGLSTAWARIFFLYGPHEPPQRLVPSVVAALLRHEPARCTSGTQTRDFLYVEDVANALTCLLANGVSGPVNIGSGKPVAIRDVVYAIADKFHRRDLVLLGALPEKVDDPPVLAADVNRLTHECGWSPKFDLESGLEKTIDWWTSQHRTTQK